MDSGLNLNLDELKEWHNGVIAAMYKEQMASGFTFKAHTFPSTPADITKLGNFATSAESSLSGGETWPTDFKWEDIHNAYHTMTAKDMLDLYATMVAFTKANDNARKVHLTEVGAFTDVDLLKAYDISTLWANYNDNYTDVIVGDSTVSAKRSKSINLVLNDGITPFIRRTTIDFSTVASMIYRGIDAEGKITSIKIVAWVNDAAAPGSIRILDSTDGHIIASKTNITNTKPTVITLENLGYLEDNEEEVFELQLKGASICVAAWSFYF